MRQDGLDEREIYYEIKDNYGHHFYDLYFTLNTLLQIDYNSDNDKTEKSLTDKTTTEETLTSSDCVESDHSSDMYD